MRARKYSVSDSEVRWPAARAAWTWGIVASPSSASASETRCGTALAIASSNGVKSRARSRGLFVAAEEGVVATSVECAGTENPDIQSISATVNRCSDFIRNRVW
jgi:hypothetical protein